MQLILSIWILVTYIIKIWKCTYIYRNIEFLKEPTNVSRHVQFFINKKIEPAKKYCSIF